MWQSEVQVRFRSNFLLEQMALHTPTPCEDLEEITIQEFTAFIIALHLPKSPQAKDLVHLYIFRIFPV